MEPSHNFAISRRGNQRLYLGSARRFEHPNIVPLELRDFRRVGSRLPVTMSVNEGWGAAVSVFLDEIHEGNIILKDRSAPDLRKLRRVFAIGGWLEDAECREALKRSKVSVHHPENPRIASLSAVSSFGDSATTLLCDIGKVFIKITFNGITRLFARNFTKFPFENPTSTRLHLIARRRLKKFLTDALKSVIIQAGGTPETVAFAIPCQISRQARPLGNPLPGMEGWKNMGEDLVSFMAPRPVKVWILNNGELVGLAALQENVIKSENFLALGLGHGVSICGIWDSGRR